MLLKADSLYTNLYVCSQKETALRFGSTVLGGYFFFRSIRKTSTSTAARETTIRTIHVVI